MRVKRVRLCEIHKVFLNQGPPHTESINPSPPPDPGARFSVVCPSHRNIATYSMYSVALSMCIIFILSVVHCAAAGRWRV